MFRFKLFAITCIVQLAVGHLPNEKSSKHSYESNVVPLNPTNSRSLAAGTNNQKALQRLWSNWNVCTNAVYNASFTPANILVPTNTVFLAGYPTVNLDNSSSTCKSKTITRSGTINVGNQTVFYPLFNGVYVDYSDDYKKGVVGCGNSSDEVLMSRLALGEAENKRITNTTYKQLLYSDIDGTAVEPVYIYDTDEFYFKACPDNRTTKEYLAFLGLPDGDSCDAEPYQVIDGLDGFPLFGWYGIDTRNWVDGETHTYEFGSLTDCYTAKYILTARAPPTKSPTKAPTKSPTKSPTKAPTKSPTKSPTKAPTKGDKCGLFGLGLFCPFEWLKWFFNLFK